MPHLDLIINAGGASRRMGMDKALLPVPPHGTPLVRHVYERLAGLATGQAIVVANDASLANKAGLPPSVRQLGDRYPNAGALGGLATGLALSTGWAIAVACDMPFVDPALLTLLAVLIAEPGEKKSGEDDGQGWDAIVPLTEGYPQPLHALYHRRCLPAMTTLLVQGNLRIVDLYDAIRVRYVSEEELRRHDPELRSFTNVNTPEEWQQVLAMMAHS